MGAGPSFWDQGILTIIRLDKVEWISETVPNVGLNVVFMILAGVALAFNIITRWVRYVTGLIYRSRSFRFAELDTAIGTSTRVADRVDRVLSDHCYTCFHSPRRCSFRSFGCRTLVWEIPRSCIRGHWCRSCAHGV